MSSASLGVLDAEDSQGITGSDGRGMGARSRNSGTAHLAAVNGLTFTDDGSYLVSAGHDDRVRVWDISTGANTLASFGPSLRNGHLTNIPLIISPSSLMAPGKELLYYPNEKEILVFEMHEGRLTKRFKVPGPNTSTIRSRVGERNIKNRITDLVWIGHANGIYSAHSDGQIRGWVPQTAEDESLDKEEESINRLDGHEISEEAQKKRKVLEDVFRDLTRQKITFG
jgi:DNA excision repair protein ERCC-8